MEGRSARLLACTCERLAAAEARWSAPEFEYVPPDGAGGTMLMLYHGEGHPQAIPCWWPDVSLLDDYDIEQ